VSRPKAIGATLSWPPAPGTSEREDFVMGWICPRCARTFARADQFHSHDTESVDAHFAGRPEHLREAFDKLTASLPSDVHVEALRTVIVLSANRTFSYVTVHSHRLLVGIFLEHVLDSPRVVKTDHVSPHKIGSVVNVRGSGDVDDELRRWIRQAYQLCTATGSRRRD
jgi:hypothetical protein